MTVFLCPECSPEPRDVEQLALGAIVPQRCGVCEKDGSAVNAYRLAELRDHWFNEGHGCGSNAMIGAGG